MKNLILCGVAALTLGFAGLQSTAEAQWGSRGYRSGRVYHGPSMHYDRTYHHDYSHWTPSRGFHSHGHVHTRPHYTPGHYHNYDRGTYYRYNNNYRYGQNRDHRGHYHR